jgi:GH15 family glucan-1,4-alpha-glucosidase
MTRTNNGSGNADLMRASVSAILRYQQPNGAIVASPDFENYQYCWLRDGSFVAFALDRAGEHEAALRFHRWVAGAIAGIADLIDDSIVRQRHGNSVNFEHMPPARFALDGLAVPDDWPNFQIDGYGTWLWALDQHLRGTENSEVGHELWSSMDRVARYVDAFALTTCFDVWEESGTARHVSTLACVYGGLQAAARMLGSAALTDRAEEVREAATEGGARLGRFVKSTQSDAVDSSLLWLATPFDLVEVDDARFTRTVEEIETQLTFEGGLRRYPEDSYYGSGAWPVLTASLGWHYAVAGDDHAAQQCLDWISEHFDEQGRLAEQFGGERRDPRHYEEWVERWGVPAADLTWSHAMHVVLGTEVEARKRALEQGNLRTAGQPNKTRAQGQASKTEALRPGNHQ